MKLSAPARSPTVCLVAVLMPVLAARSPPIVRTELGPVRGNALLHADEFVGIPYASAERFQPAIARAKRFDRTPLDAIQFGPACLQTLTNITTYGVEHGCHVLNIWRPAGASAADELPVMMYVPGGSNDFGEAEPYNASAMAADQHAIICSINYRVGPFGFVALDEDRQHGKTTGNYALTDIQAALRFVRRHIDRFGGRASRVTLFGQSSAGSLVLLQSVLPSSAGLVQGVLSQSGQLEATSWEGSLHTTATLARALNCSERHASVRECLLAADADDLVYAQGVVCFTPNDCSASTSWGPTVDGLLLPSSPHELLRRRQINPGVAVALGGNTNDSYLFVQNEGPLSRNEYIGAVKYAAGGSRNLTARLLALYPPHDDPQADNIDVRGWLESDHFLCRMRRTAGAFASAGAPTFLYRFDWHFQSNSTCTAVANWHPVEMGSMHQDEVSFVFGQPIFMNIGYSNCSVPGWHGYSPTCLGCRFNATELRFAREVGRLWVGFAKGGSTGEGRAGALDDPCAGHRCDVGACPCGCECGNATDPGVCYVPSRANLNPASSRALGAIEGDLDAPNGASRCTREATASSMHWQAVDEWPRFDGRGRNIHLRPQTLPDGKAAPQQTETAMGRAEACTVWDAVDGA